MPEPHLQRSRAIVVRKQAATGLWPGDHVPATAERPLHGATTIGSAPFCTQRCLCGLVQGRELDQTCPNVHLHRGQGDRVRHPLSHREWLQLLHEQLRETLDVGVEPMGKQGHAAPCSGSHSSHMVTPSSARAQLRNSLTISTMRPLYITG